MRDLDIGDVARRTGLAASTLRFYEQKGLIASHGRHGLRRQYPESVLDRLALVALAQAAGFALAEIRQLFAADGSPKIDRGMLAARAATVDRRIRRLLAVRNGLRHAARCPAPSHMECPTFRRLLRAAVAGDLGSAARRAR